MHNKLLWISLVDQVILCGCLFIYVGFGTMHPVLCSSMPPQRISNNFHSSCCKLRLQSYRLPEGGAPTPSHCWTISVISPNFGRFCFIVLYCCWFGPHTGAEWKCVIVETPVCCVFLRIVPIFCCLISFFIIPYVHTLPLSPQHERQHILRVSMTWIFVQPWIFTCLLFLCIPLFTLLEWWYKPAFSSIHHFLRIVTT